MTEVIVYLALILAGGFGFCIAFYINTYKRIKSHLMVCPLKFHCDPVINSKYSKLFGIPLEFLGMAYYGIIFLSYIFFLVTPYLIPNWFSQSVAYASIAAFIFSMYLTYLQAFKIRNWCSWCLMSASLCVIIFVLSFFA